ncbi:Uncharacterised protein [Mycobacterium tuberculosis]|uniref:Uncharacterized protein n=1 Tax=Mycobacterium tuberculosis TaxID=1773 RepID=A0A916PBS2_MYCTX|nr:Uncharacterised protein [Mycobacterium tuberculosis]
MPIQIHLLISRRQPRTHRRPPPPPRLPGWLVDKNHSPNPAGGNRQPPDTQPAIRNNPRHTVALSPHHQIHTSVPTTHHRQPTTTQTQQLTAPSGHRQHRPKTPQRVNAPRCLQRRCRRLPRTRPLRQCDVGFTPVAMVPAQTTGGTAHKRRERIGTIYRSARHMCQYP